jgi:hypothetical protein
MSGLLFLLFNIGVVLVAHWCLKNDSPSLDGATTGLFAMAKPTSCPPSASKPAAKKIVPVNLRLPRLTRR